MKLEVRIFLRHNAFIVRCGLRAPMGALPATDRLTVGVVLLLLQRDREKIDDDELGRSEKMPTCVRCRLEGA